MYHHTWFERANGVLEEVFRVEESRIVAAGGILADTLAAGGLIYAFGSGHSHMMAEELFYRAGGLAAVCPILEPEIMLHTGAVKSSLVERTGEYARCVLSRYPIGEKDCLVVISNSGINPLPIEVARIARERGAKVIGISSACYQANPSRHPAGLHLPDVVDLCIDNHVPMGDALVTISDAGETAGPVSTMVGAALVNAIALDACQLLQQRGMEPQVFRSSNCPGPEDHNLRLAAEYSPRVRAL